MMTLNIKPLRTLFRCGTCQAGDPGLDPLLAGLVHPGGDGARWVLSRRLLAVRDQLSTDDETIAAILARDGVLRSAWARILAARCREAAELSDPGSLVQLVTRLKGAAGWVETAMVQQSLAPTPAVVIERELLGAPAEQARATPGLVRAMAAASVLDAWRDEPLPLLSTIDGTGERVDDNWCAGRLLALPDAAGCAADPQWLLSGVWPGAVDREALDALRNWVLPNPWPLLLAVIGYVQETWAAEGRGGLLLELPQGQSPHHPSEVQVLVAGADGAEVLCGSLGGLVLGLLRRRGMRFFPREPDEAALNALLSPLIGELLRRRVWHFHEALSGQQGQYGLSPGFSDACYRISGTRSLGRNARALRSAIREQAQLWRLDWQGRVDNAFSGSLRAAGTAS